LGHVLFAPPIVLDPKGYTQDVAIIEIDDSKIDSNRFKGNVIDLGTKLGRVELTDDASKP
jgi:hypothetical protein